MQGNIAGMPAMPVPAQPYAYQPGAKRDITMFAINQIILLTAVLLLLGIISSKASARLGLPVLVLFLLSACSPAMAVSAALSSTALTRPMPWRWP